ncbi:FAD-binding oxidoreductase [Phyllobacterium myrsinacearum]|uniref:FAD/FMN-containing dehydrogenase n=1 Tax=Phyllobacterium myrsinacearum TaxID=28101 RepID=A0A839EES0_9HYPH|nr:FAD-binding oxidoreductase [Phyllobacterium myrsinacearum]MBA8878613.1 FAD/FMN-containing dehydrogenase [Phyllobacterium myrsinacearum]
MTREYESFGRIDRRRRSAISLEEARQAFELALPGSYLPFGNGKSYGDSCHNDRGLLVDMRPNNQLISFSARTGILQSEAGMLLSDVLAIAAPQGYFLPVTPGTRFVTLGGAIANDVHGKNHHRRGTFGCHVDSFDLLRSDGSVTACSATENADLFRATIGGLGLTGIIQTASIRLMRVGSLDIEERVTRFKNLDAYFDLAAKADDDNEYAVAWVDQLSGGRDAGRGVLLTGNHADNGNFDISTGTTRFRVPVDLPVSALNFPSLKLFNAAYYHRKGSRAGTGLTGYVPFFYPLDQVRNWNRLYGRAGLYQHQSVIPEMIARETIAAMLAVTRQAGQNSFLTVLKRFGAAASPGILSFPRAGYTLTLDFPNRGRKTLALLAQLDRMTIDAGGRVNPYKDQRMSAAVFKAGFPQWSSVEALRDQKFVSNFWDRTALSGE